MRGLGWGGSGMCSEEGCRFAHLQGLPSQCVFHREWHPTIPTQFVGYNVNNGSEVVQLSSPLVVVTHR